MSGMRVFTRGSRPVRSRIGTTLSVLAMAVVACASRSAKGATVVWGGGSGTFSTAANWIGGSAPGSTDTVSFGGWAPLDRTAWTVSASVTGSGSAASNATDSHRATVWTTTVTQAVNQSFTIDMGSAQTFRQITIDSAGNTSDYPRAFNVYASSDGTSWGSPITSGAGVSALVTVTLTTAVTNRYIKIQLSSSAGNAWSIGELFVYGTASETELSRSGWVASASASTGGAASNAIDGSTGTRFSPGAVQASGQWLSLDMGSARTFTRIDMDAYSSPGDYPHGYDVYVSTDGSTWGSAIASQTPSTEYTSITFTAQTKRYIKIQLNAPAAGGNWWSLYEIKVYGTPANCNLSANVTAAAISLDTSMTVTQASGVTIALTGSYSQSAGTFAGGNSTFDIAGSFSLTGGTFTATSGRLEIGAGFSKTGGTFTHNSGQVMLNATSGTQAFASGGATFNNLTVNDGLVGYWKLDEGAGLAAADSSGYGNNGTLANTFTWLNSGLPNVNFTDTGALSFNGTSNYVTLGTTSLPANNAAQTISLWAKLSTTAGIQNLIALLNLSNSAIQLEVRSGVIGAYNWGSGTLVSTTAPNTTQWHHIAYTYDGASHQTLYVDGVATTATVANQTGSASFAYLGTYSPSNDLYSGYLDEVRIYRRALSGTEISSLYLGNQPGTYQATQTLTGSPTVSGDLTLATGYLSMGANTISVGGNLWNYGGIVDATYWGAASIAFTGSGLTNKILSGGQVLPSLSFTGSGTWTLADNLTVDPNDAITVTTGSLDLSTRTVRTGSVADNGSGTITTTNATVILSSAGNQTVNATSYNTFRIEDPTETNLTAYWKLDEGQGIYPRDWTGNGHTGILTNSPRWSTTVPSSPALEFYDPASVTFVSGSSTYMDGGLSPVTTSAPFSVCAWANLTSTTGKSVLVSDAGSSYSAFMLYYNTDVSPHRFTFLSRTADATASSSVADTTVSPAAGTWYHVCGVYDGTYQHIYVNGSENVSAVSVGAPFNATGHLYVGANLSAGSLANYADATIDDVRIYGTALIAAQVKQLANGRYANTGGTSTFTMGGTFSASGRVDVDSGTFNPGAYTATATGGLTVHNGGTLRLDTASGAVSLGTGTNLIVDGTLYASTSSASIKSSGTYTFKVGSTSTATPTLNINGLAVSNTDANGMWINANTSASTTFTRFDNIAFSSGTSGGELLQIYATALYLASNGCTFDAGVATGTTSVAVLLTGNGTGDGETRAVFGKTTCANNWTVGASDRTCLELAQGSSLKAKTDGDADGNGVADSPTVNGGAVVQFVRATGSDTAGTLVGMPTAAFNWNTFAYYSTYAAYNTASGTSPSIYVRNGSGTAQYSWTGSSGETIVGTPRWNTDTTTGNHYLYVAMSSGQVYQLIDTGAALTTTGAAWTTNPYDCTCAIVTPLSMDTTNLYWGGTQSGSQKLWTLSQSSPATQPMGSPFAISGNPTITNAAPLLWTSGATTYLFVGTTGHILQLNVSAQTPLAVNDNPGTASIWGRIAMGTKTTNRVLAGDDAGKLWSIDPTSFSGTAKQWFYPVASDSIKSSPYYDYTTDTVMFGTEGGKMVSLTSAGAVTSTAAVGTFPNAGGYPYSLASSSDSIRSAPLYRGGVLLVGTTTGKLLLFDRNNGTGASLIRQYYFGPTESVSGIAFDPQTSRYMVTTSDPSANDGKLYYIDAVTDPTPAAL